MRLSELVASAAASDPELGWDYAGDVASTAATEISGLALDSRSVRRGDLFFCVPGQVVDGHDFAAAARDSGASALVVDHEVPALLPQVVVTAVRPAMAQLSAVFYDNPSRSLTLVGVTGTNGKTTTASLVHSIFMAAGLRSDLIGTLTGSLTTPEAPHLQAALRAMVDDGVRAVAMEVSSHALVQDRVTGTHFDVGIFTNLTPDHLDYHESLDDYFDAKASLFGVDRVAAAVINVDDAYGRRLADRAPMPVTTVSRRDVDIARVDLGGSRFSWRSLDIELALPGLFNIDNAIAAASAASLVGIGADAIVEGLGSAPSVPGRFEVVPHDGDAPVVIVDFAHTPDGIEKVLGSLRAIAPTAPVTIVFGCGGDRDVAKRPLMAAAAEAGADRVVVTSDNPRSEPPEAIVADVVSGLERPADAVVDTDRRSAIERAIRSAGPSGVVVIAGKGAETSQTIGDQVLAFDDRVVAAEVLAELNRGSR